MTCVVTSELDELIEVCTRCVAHGSSASGRARIPRWRGVAVPRTNLERKRVRGVSPPVARVVARQTARPTDVATYITIELRPLPVEYRGFDE
jgi:hypothetical protein